MAKALPAYGEQQVHAWQDLGAFVGVNYYLVQGREVQIRVDVHATCLVITIFLLFSLLLLFGI